MAPAKIPGGGGSLALRPLRWPGMPAFPLGSNAEEPAAREDCHREQKKNLRDKNG